MKKTKLNLKNLYLLLMGLLIPVYAIGSEDAVATDEKPYQIIDGNIDNNTLEGWKDFQRRRLRTMSWSWCFWRYCI